MEISLTLTEDILIAQCLAGKESSYTVLYQRYVKSVYHTVLRIMSNQVDAEDVVQEAFTKAFEQLDTLKNLQNFEGWTKRIAINIAISQLRKRNLTFVNDEIINEIADEELNEDEDWIFQCKVEEVKKCIQELPDGYRTIISLYLFEEMEQNEIANLLGINPSTVRSQYHRAKNKVMNSLKDKVYER